MRAYKIVGKSESCMVYTPGSALYGCHYLDSASAGSGRTNRPVRAVVRMGRADSGDHLHLRCTLLASRDLKHRITPTNARIQNRR